MNNYCGWREHVKRVNKEGLINFLLVPEVKNFYSENGGIGGYNKFSELVKNVEYAQIYLKFKGDNNSFLRFLAESKNVENFNGLKENNLEFVVERVMTALSMDGKYFYELYPNKIEIKER